MVDWRKEIKLSDVVRRKREDAPESPPAEFPPVEEATAEVVPASPVNDVSPPSQPLPEPPVVASPPTEAFELPPPEFSVPAAEADPFVVSPAPVPEETETGEVVAPQIALPAPPPLLAAPVAPVPPPRPGIHPPVTADELASTGDEPAEAAPKTSFWKQDVSVGRGAKKYAELKTEGGEQKKPFWKQELSFRRKPKSGDAEPAAREAKRPFWKKELSLGRGSKPVAEPKQPKQPKAAKPKGEKTPFWKKDLSLGRKPKPAAEKRDSAPPAPKVALRERLSRPRGGSVRASKRNKRLIGLKIGASQLAAARVVNNGSPEVVQTARDALEPGIVVGGELREPEALAEALRLFFRKHKLPRQDVRLGIANNRIGVRLFEIEGIAESRQLENAIRFRAQEALPIPIEEAVLDYHVLGETVNDEGTPVRRVLLVVAYRELIDRYVSACKKAGLRLAGIDLEAFALLRALGEPREADAPAEAALVVVSVGHERSTFAVSDGRVCEFTRVLEWGGSTLNVALARALDTTPSEAEPIKRALSLEHEAVPEGLSDGQAAEAREAIRRQLQTFARELVSSLQFYQNQPGSLGIGEIVITGGTAHLPGLAQELQRLIGVQVRVGDPLARVRLGKRVRDPEQLGSLAVAIGLGIED